jgi:hypothetical protein
MTVTKHHITQAFGYNAGNNHSENLALDSNFKDKKLYNLCFCLFKQPCVSCLGYTLSNEKRMDDYEWWCGRK